MSTKYKKVGLRSTFVASPYNSRPQTSSAVRIAFREDESRVRQGHADQNLAVLRRLALNLLRQESTAPMGTKAKRLKAGWDHAYLLKILGTSMRSPWGP